MVCNVMVSIAGSETGNLLFEGKRLIRNKYTVSWKNRLQLPIFASIVILTSGFRPSSIIETQ